MRSRPRSFFAHVPLGPWLRLGVLAGLLAMAGQFVAQPGGWSAWFGQATAQETNPPLVPGAPAEPMLEDVAPAAPGGPASAAPNQARQRTLLDTIYDGGWIGAVILLLSLVAVGFMIEHALTLRKSRLMPPADLEQLEQLIGRGDVPAAIQYCQNPQHQSLATEVVLAGLERYQGSEFGFAEYKSAVEEAGEDYTARLYRKTDVLSVIGAIAPMLGLFGTVEGMMESFNTIASRGGMARPDELAGSIGKALVTTWLGLLVAMPAMVAFTYFRSQIDSIVSECGKHVERILMPLGRKK